MNEPPESLRRQWPSIVVAAWITFALMFAASSPAGEVDFSREIRPILADNCYECHGPDEESRRGGLRLDVLHEAIGTVISPGDVESSSLVDRLVSEDRDDVMPPSHSKRRPTKKQIQDLKHWIEQGASFEEHWAFVAPVRPFIPSVKKMGWPRNPIDNFIAAHHASESLTPRGDAMPRVLARRLSLALTGLPMLPKQADAFAAEYERTPERAVSSLVDALLASEAYGEHRAWFWLDAARYADTNGYQADGHRVMWPWRDWLIRNLNANLPFDQLTERMLAGDLLIPEEQRNWQSADWIVDDESSRNLVATGFLRNHRYDTGSGTIPAESKFQNAADRMETVATVWMGMTMLCARCHTHKYDPIKNREYYELLSFFDNVREAGSALTVASHPYIHTPAQDERAKLKQLHQAVIDADAAMTAAGPEIASAQKRWEEIDAPVSMRVRRGLRFRYAKEPIYFDGDTSIEKSKDPIALCAGNRQWTISFWFRPESKTDAAIFSSVQEPERYRQGIQADWVDGKIRVRHVCRWVNSYIEFESAKRLAIGQWHHVTFRCDGRMQGIAYSASVDGSDDAMLCTHSVTNDSASTAGKEKLILGGSPFLPGLVGEIRELRFYDRELDRGEVRSLADQRKTNEIARVPVDKRTPVESEGLRLAFIDDFLGDPERKRVIAGGEDSLSGVSDDLNGLRLNQLDARARLREAIAESPTTMVMKEGRTKPTRMRLAGVFDALGDNVIADTPDFLPRLTSGRGGNVNRREEDGSQHAGRVPRSQSVLSEEHTRLDLARWLTRPDHPLTARVAVNRIWQTLWGRGFVDAPENFGTQTALPLHADLLDWLAIEYVQSGWDTKALIKLIVTSRAFRQSSDATDAMWKVDPANRHLARGPRYRLPVHIVRDQALLLSGRLKQSIGGPPVIVDEVIGKDGRAAKLPYEKSDRRRTLYTFWKRNSPHPMLAVFDVADRNQCEVRSMRTNTPLQALVTLNEPGFAAAARALGERAVGMSETLEGRIRWTWQACTGQIPSADELAMLSGIYEDYLKLAEGSETRAWTAFCNVLLNLDQTLTME